MSPGICRAAPDLTIESRKLMWSIVETLDRSEPDENPGIPGPPRAIHAWPDTCPPIEASVARFLPTAILFRSLDWSDRPVILADDGGERPGFLSAVYMAEEVREYPWGRLKVLAGRSFLQPPATREECPTRLERMMALDHGVPLDPSLGFQPFCLTGLMSGPERRIAARMAPADQLALVTVLAARSRSAAFISPTGQWPDRYAVLMMADRLGCRIHRFSFAGIPSATLFQVRHSRYNRLRRAG